jgi:hypothetical protein
MSPDNADAETTTPLIALAPLGPTV